MLPEDRIRLPGNGVMLFFCKDSDTDFMANNDIVRRTKAWANAPWGDGGGAIPIGQCPQLGEVFAAL